MDAIGQDLHRIEPDAKTLPSAVPDSDILLGLPPSRHRQFSIWCRPVTGPINVPPDERWKDAGSRILLQICRRRSPRGWENP